MAKIKRIITSTAAMGIAAAMIPAMPASTAKAASFDAETVMWTNRKIEDVLAEVYLDFGHESDNAENYTKSLDMKTGIVTVEYDYNGSHYKRESFASYPDQTVDKLVRPRITV